MTKSIILTTAVSLIYFSFLKLALAEPSTMTMLWAIGTTSFCYGTFLGFQLIEAWASSSEEDTKL